MDDGAPGGASTDSPRGPWLRVEGVGLAILAVALTGWGVAQPLLWPYLIGAGLVGLSCAAVVNYLLAVRSRGRPSRVVASLAVGVLVAGVVVAVPWTARVVQADSTTRWRADLPTRWVNVIPWRDRTYLYEEFHGFRVLDSVTGRELFAVGGVKVLGDITGDGSMVLYNKKQGAEHYAADGRRLWRLDGRAWAEVAGANSDVDVAAAAGGTVVFRVGERTGYRYVAVDRTGAIAWQRVAANQWVNTQVPYADAGKGGPLPAVVVVRTSESDDAEIVTYAVTDGKELDRRPVRTIDNVGVVGDLVVFGGAGGFGCGYTAVRDGRQVWQANDLPCSDGSTPSPLLLERRLYAEVDGYASITLDLRSGKWRKIAHVALSSQEQGLRKIGLPGADVIVYRNARKLTGVDAAKGTKLWTFEQPGEDTPGVDVGNETIVVYGDPGGHNPAIPPDVRRSGYGVSVLDARTGERTGQTVLPVDGLATSGPLPGGRAVLVTAEETQALLVGRKP